MNKKRQNRGNRPQGDVLTLKSVTDIIVSAKVRSISEARAKVAFPHEIARFERDATHKVPHLKLSLFRKEDGEMMVRIFEANGKRYQLLWAGKDTTRGTFSWSHVESAVCNGFASSLGKIDVENVDEFIFLVTYLSEILTDEIEVEDKKKADDSEHLTVSIGEIVRQDAEAPQQAVAA